MALGNDQVKDFFLSLFAISVFASFLFLPLLFLFVIIKNKVESWAEDRPEKSHFTTLGL